MSNVTIQRRSPPARELRGDCFALRDLCEPRHHRFRIAVKDLRARILANVRFRKRLAGPLAAEFGSVRAAHDALGAVQPTAASIAPGPNELQSTYTFARRKRDDRSSCFGEFSRIEPRVRLLNSTNSPSLPTQILLTSLRIRCVDGLLV